MCSNQEQYQRQGTEQHEETVQPQAMMSKPVLNALKHVPTTLSSTIAKPPENKSGLCFAGRNRFIFNASGEERCCKQDYQLSWISVALEFDPLRSDPRFADLVSS